MNVQHALLSLDTLLHQLSSVFDRSFNWSLDIEGNKLWLLALAAALTALVAEVIFKSQLSPIWG